MMIGLRDLEINSVTTKINLSKSSDEVKLLQTDKSIKVANVHILGKRSDQISLIPQVRSSLVKAAPKTI